MFESIIDVFENCNCILVHDRRDASVYERRQEIDFSDKQTFDGTRMTLDYTALVSWVKEFLRR